MGFTSISTLEAECTYTRSLPALFRGLSSSASSSWWRMSGRKSPGFFPCFFIMP